MHLELWQFASILSLYGLAVVYVVTLKNRTSATARRLEQHEDGCAKRYAEMARQRQEDIALAAQQRREDREWMTAISKKLDRLVERHMP